MAQNQSGYSTAQIMEMQRDAMRRVNEMQKVAQQKVAQTDQVPLTVPSPSIPSLFGNAPSEPHQQEKPIMQSHEQQNLLLAPPEQKPIEIMDHGFKGILDKLNLDDEKIILILLLFLLISEGADTMLILAIGYILI